MCNRNQTLADGIRSNDPDAKLKLQLKKEQLSVLSADVSLLNSKVQELTVSRNNARGAQRVIAAVRERFFGRPDGTGSIRIGKATQKELTQVNDAFVQKRTEQIVATDLAAGEVSTRIKAKIGANTGDIDAVQKAISDVYAEMSQKRGATGESELYTLAFERAKKSLEVAGYTDSKYINKTADSIARSAEAQVNSTKNMVQFAYMESNFITISNKLDRLTGIDRELAGSPSQAKKRALLKEQATLVRETQGSVRSLIEPSAMAKMTTIAKIKDALVTLRIDASKQIVDAGGPNARDAASIVEQAAASRQKITDLQIERDTQLRKTTDGGARDQIQKDFNTRIKTEMDTLGTMLTRAQELASNAPAGERVQALSQLKDVHSAIKIRPFRRYSGHQISAGCCYGSKRQISRHQTYRQPNEAPC
jgi:DNA replication protein DnaD